VDSGGVSGVVGSSSNITASKGVFYIIIVEGKMIDGKNGVANSESENKPNWFHDLPGKL